MWKPLTAIILFVIGAVPLNAEWMPLPPVGNGCEVGPGGYAARGRGYTFVAIGDGSFEIYAFDHSADTWGELENDMPEVIDRAGAMTYAHGNGTRLFVATDEGNNLFVYSFHQSQGLGGYWNEDNPISLPDTIGDGVALAYQPVLFSPPNPGWGKYIEGYLYLLVGNETRHLWRRAFCLFPVAVDGRYPGNGSVVVAGNLYFDWLPHPRWTEYNLQVSTSEDFTNLIIDTTVFCGEFDPANVLFGTGTYYWRLRGIRSGIPSDWSETWCFTLTTGSGSVNFHPFPDEGVLIAGDEPVFDWQSVPDAAFYWLQVAPTSDFAQPVIDVRTERSEFVADQPIESGTYYWRVCYRRAGGSWTNWSTPISFQVDYGWHRLPDIPTSNSVEQGGAMCYAFCDDVEALYVMLGGNSNEFWRFNLETMNWEQLNSTPGAQKGGASITSDDFRHGAGSRKLRAIMGGETNYLFTYDISNNSWRRADTLPPRDYYRYGSCVCDGDNDYPLVLVIAGEYEETNFYKWVVGVDEGQMAQSKFLPMYGDFRLLRSNRGAQLIYTVKRDGLVKVAIFDQLGRRIKTLFNGWQSAGEHTLNLNIGSRGVYFISLDINGERGMIKIPVW